MQVNKFEIENNVVQTKVVCTDQSNFFRGIGFFSTYFHVSTGGE